MSVEKFLEVVRSGESVRDITEGPVGVLFADAGGRSDAGLSVNLRPGEKYAVICIFRDSADAKRHYDLGMYTAISIDRAQAVAPLPQLPTDTIIATDYAFQYPRQVRPGKHTFLMLNRGKQRHQLALSLLRKGVTLDSVAKVEDAGGDPDALFEGSFGLLHGRAGQDPVGELTLTMLPDRDYVIACFLKDDEQSPEHVDLGMFGIIRTGQASETDSTWEKQQAVVEKVMDGSITLTTKPTR